VSKAMVAASGRVVLVGGVGSLGAVVLVVVGGLVGAVVLVLSCSEVGAAGISGLERGRSGVGWSGLEDPGSS
jgi:hypothetical protein